MATFSPPDTYHEWWIHNRIKTQQKDKDARKKNNNKQTEYCMQFVCVCVLINMFQIKFAFIHFSQHNFISNDDTHTKNMKPSK